jgi:hypothetical protein
VFNRSLLWRLSRFARIEGRRRLLAVAAVGTAVGVAEIVLTGQVTLAAIPL